MTNLLEIERLSVQLPVEGHVRPVIHEVSLELAAGRTIGLVGESGSGKSLTARAIARLLPTGARVGGSVRFDGTDVLGLRGKALREFRIRDVAMIFQDPRAHINPVRRIGDFLTEALRLNQGMSAPAANKRAIELLDEVGIADGERRLRQYPHELSGGLLQRVMIASVVAAKPRLILADEPTTALDVTTQAEVMAVLSRLRAEYEMAMLFITHDLELAAAVCDQTAVMYAGSIVETQPSAELLDAPLHPYTAALVSARPDIDHTAPRLRTVPGHPTTAFEAPAGCAFAPRCSFAQEGCTDAQQLRVTETGGSTRCWRTDELRDRLLAGNDESTEAAG